MPREGGLQHRCVRAACFCSGAAWGEMTRCCPLIRSSTQRVLVIRLLTNVVWLRRHAGGKLQNVIELALCCGIAFLMGAPGVDGVRRCIRLSLVFFFF
jgi:hypothetical protein